MAKQACQLIDLRKLVPLVRANLVGLNNTGTVDEIETILFHFEKIIAVSTLPTSELAVEGLIDDTLVLSASNSAPAPLDPCPIVQVVVIDSLAIADLVVQTPPSGETTDTAVDCSETPLQDSSKEIAGVVSTCATRPESHATSPADPAPSPTRKAEARA